MLKKKRSLPDSLVAAKKRIDSWRAGQLRTLHPDPLTVLWLLTNVACADVWSRRLKAKTLEERADIEDLTRAYLFALQSAVYDLTSPQSRWSDHIQDTKFQDDMIADARHHLQMLIDYTVFRDAVLTFAWGGYELDDSSDDCISFVDAENWLGAEDYANVLMDRVSKAEAIDSGLQNEFDLPGDLELNGVTAGMFFSMWNKLGNHVANPIGFGMPHVISKTEITALFNSDDRYSNIDIENFIDLITFDTGGRQAMLTLFHCPLVPVDRTIFIVIPLAFGAANLNTVIARLASIRGHDQQTLGIVLSSRLLHKICQHYSSPHVTIKTNVPYRGPSDEGDIDLLIHEPAENRVILAQVKGFIMPDTVEETVRTNVDLLTALDQACRAREWMRANSPIELCQRFPDIPWDKEPNIASVVIGNGNAGSDYLRSQSDVPVVDARFLLLERFRGTRLSGAILEHESAIERIARQVKQEHEVAKMELAGIRIRIPGWQGFL